MKRFLFLGLVLISVCVTLIFAAENPPLTQSIAPQVPEMSTAGKVLEITDKSLKIERTLKGKAEIMEFSLEKSFADIKVGDQIKVSYLEKEGRNILIRVSPAKKTAVQKTKKDAAKTATPEGAKEASATK
jgi:hypothetical protein